MTEGPADRFHDTILMQYFDYKSRHWFKPLIDTHRAWSLCLVEAGAMAESDARSLWRALEELERIGPDGVLPYDRNFEYFYLHVERFLTERVGEDVAGNLNLGRTRPEPLTRMVLRGLLLDILDELLALRKTVLDLALREADTVMPGYTHCQQGQPTTLGHYLSAVAEHLARDCARLTCAYRTTNRCTLGCGALSGTSYPVDRELAAELLGFDGILENTFDCVASMDHKVEAMAALSGCMVALSRVAQDLHQWCTPEYGMAEVADGYASISSLMPQKKNSLVFEYVRSRAAAVVGDLTATLAMEHNTFFQDVEDICIEVELPVTHAFQDASRAIRLLEGVLSTIEFKRERMRRLANAGFSTASELADVIHRDCGLSYRSAHRVVARVVRGALDRGLAADEVGVDLVQESAIEVIGVKPDLAADRLADALDATGFVNNRAVAGSPLPDRLAAMLESGCDRVAADGRIVADARRRLRDAEASLRSRVAEPA